MPSIFPGGFIFQVFFTIKMDIFKVDAMILRWKQNIYRPRNIANQGDNVLKSIRPSNLSRLNRLTYDHDNWYAECSKGQRVYVQCCPKKAAAAVFRRF